MSSCCVLVCCFWNKKLLVVKKTRLLFSSFFSSLNSRTAELQNSRTPEQQNNRTAEQQNSRTAPLFRTRKEAEQLQTCRIQIHWVIVMKSSTFVLFSCEPMFCCLKQKKGRHAIVKTKNTIEKFGNLHRKQTFLF